MKATLYMAAISALIAAPVQAKQVRVKSYVTKRGAVVMPTVRTSPNRTRADNWSSRPNLNPYTGKFGTVDPFMPKN